MTWESPKTNWKAGDVPTKDDFNRIENNVHILGQLDRTSNYGVVSGTNAKRITLSPAPERYIEGMTIAFKNNTPNTGSVTINVNGLGAKSIKKSNGNNLSSGNLKKDSIYTIRYNGTNFILQGEGGEGTAQPNQVLEGETFTNDEDVQIGTMPNVGKAGSILTKQNETYYIPRGYHNGEGIVKAQFANLTAGNIRKGINIGGVIGTITPKTVVSRSYSGTVYDDSPDNYTFSYSNYDVVIVVISGYIVYCSEPDISVTDEIQIGTLSRPGYIRITNRSESRINIRVETIYPWVDYSFTCKAIGI